VKMSQSMSDRALVIVTVLCSAIAGAAMVVILIGLFFIHTEISKLRNDILILDNYNQTIERLESDE
jgi:hypothetical protein